MRRRVLTTTVAVGMLLAATALGGCTQGDGPVVERSRDVGAFSGIDAGGGVQVHVTIGATTSLVVHAQANIQDKVATEVRSDGTLRIEATEDFVVADPVVIDLTTPTLTAISLSGGAAVELDGLEADALEVSLSGGARATISGAATALTISGRGGSTASLGELASETIAVSLDGGATAEVDASGSVRGSASGGAKLRVSGEATVEVETSGGAEVSHS